jgi:hypothetical protein
MEQRPELARLPDPLGYVLPLVVNLASRPLPAFDIYIGRTFAGRTDIGFGNPLRLRHEGEAPRAELLVAYWAWLNGSDARARAVRRRVRAGELAGQVLGCWCAGKGLCHGYVLAGLANGDPQIVKNWIAQLALALRPGPPPGPPGEG